MWKWRTVVQTPLCTFGSGSGQRLLQLVKIRGYGAGEFVLTWHVSAGMLEWLVWLHFHTALISKLLLLLTSYMGNDTFKIFNNVLKLVFYLPAVSLPGRIAANWELLGTLHLLKVNGVTCMVQHINDTIKGAKIVEFH